MIELQVSEDKMKMYASIPLDTEGNFFEPIKLFNFLKSQGVNKGFNVEAIKSAYHLYQTEKKVSNILIAQGTAPTKASKGEFVLTSQQAQTGTLREDGSMDFREKNLYRSVSCDELIATLSPVRENEDGVDIYGNAVRPEADSDGGEKDKEIKVGENVFYNEENRTYTAKIDGMLIIKDNEISVTEALVLQDIDMETGNWKH